ncbi:hypothetical protein RUND412_005100 [Rhizina undulata]
MSSALMNRLNIHNYTKPIFIFALVSLSISLVFSVFIICGSTSDGLRKFYLISLAYNPDESSVTSTVLEGVDKVSSGISSLFSSSSSSDKNTTTLELLRISYRGICLENTKGWECAKDGDALKALAGGTISGDPLSLVSIADLYKEKVAWNFPWWAAIAFLSIAWIMTIINCIPMIEMPVSTRKAMSVASSVGCVCLLGAMVLQDVTTGAVSSLVQKVSFEIVEAHVGRANIAFGWSAFGLSLLAALASMAVVTAEWGVNTVRSGVQEKLSMHS